METHRAARWLHVGIFIFNGVGDASTHKIGLMQTRGHHVIICCHAAPLLAEKHRLFGSISVGARSVFGFREICPIEMWRYVFSTILWERIFEFLPYESAPRKIQRRVRQALTVSKTTIELLTTPTTLPCHRKHFKEQ